MPLPLRKNSNVTFRDEHPDLGDGREEILSGLRGTQKTLNPKWFYDQRGSELFDRITRLSEYYPTRTEVGILQSNVEAICAACGDRSLLIEPGSGSSEKVRILLESLRPAAYVPVDISADFLETAAVALGEEYPWLQVHAVCADFNHNWSYLDNLPDAKRVVFYPGSTLGNLEPDVARQFLRRLRSIVGSDGGVLIGVDTHKDSARLNAAYNDAEGVTAEFNLNILRRLDVLLDAEFSRAAFRHRAFYNEEQRRIEMHLVSERAQAVRCNGAAVTFVEGETIHTENSYKYTVEGFTALAKSAGLRVEKTWMDSDALFAVYYLRVDEMCP